MRQRESTAAALIRQGAKTLKQAGCDSPLADAQWLLSHLTGQKPTELFLRESALADETVESFREKVALRARGSPLQYLLGCAPFYGADFNVEAGVFIPRPETESVVAAAISRLRELEKKRGRRLRLLDVGAGSGAIAVTLARELPTCWVAAIEVSWNAIFVAQSNLRRHDLSGRVQLICGRWMEAVGAGGLIDGIVANPPYVPSRQVDALPLEVRQEPRLSLDGGPDGLRDIRNILADAPRVLSDGGIMAFECGEKQLEALRALACALPWVARVDPIDDLAGRPRGCVVVRSD